MVSNLLPFYSEKAEKLRIRFKIYFQFKLQAKASKWFCQSQQPVYVRMGLWHMRCLYQGWHPEKSWLCSNRDKYWALKWQDCLRKPIGYRLANWVYCKPLSPWKDHCFILTGIDSFSKYGFVFPASRVLAGITIWGFVKCLFHWHKIPHYIALGDIFFRKGRM